MKKNNAAYSILSADDPGCPDSPILLSSAVVLQNDHERLPMLNMNVTNFLNF